RPGMSAFALEDGALYHTYSSYARGLDGLWGMYQWLDRAPKRRNETGVFSTPSDQHIHRRARLGLPLRGVRVSRRPTLDISPRINERPSFSPSQGFPLKTRCNVTSGEGRLGKISISNNTYSPSTG